jgi:hypothetical protein
MKITVPFMACVVVTFVNHVLATEVVIGRGKTTPAIITQALLGVSRCNSANVGGEDSADSTKDCRVL